MFLNKLSARPKSGEIHVLIEIPAGVSPIKYEFDKDTAAIFVDRFMQVAMTYPCNYGFIPQTLSGDDDPVDVLVISQHAVIPGAVIKARAIGVLMMEDESGTDEKIIAVPVSKLDPLYDDIKDIDDLNQILKERIKHFFEHYKDLEKGKWVKILGYENVNQAEQLIEQGIARAKSQLHP